MMYPAPQPGGAEPPDGPTPGPPASAPSARGGRLALLLVLTVAVIAAAGALAGYQLTRTGGPAIAVGDCVNADELPIEYDCGEDRAKYHVLAREPMQRPVALACLKYAEATRAVAEPLPAAREQDTVLCLAPTRANISDPGGLRPGDCIAVREGGDEIERSPCGFPSVPLDVIAIELHTKIPVTDQACEAYPAARDAYAQLSLGGRVVVICTKPNEFSTSTSGAQVGDCYTDESFTEVGCDHPSAAVRVLDVRTQYMMPTSVKCPGVTNATTASVSGNERTDLVVVVCLGPIDARHLGYAEPGDCVAGFGVERVMPKLVHCGDATADGTVTSVYDQAEVGCSPGEARMTRKGSVGDDVTICVAAL